MIMIHENQTTATTRGSSPVRAHGTRKIVFEALKRLNLAFHSFSGEGIIKNLRGSEPSIFEGMTGPEFWSTCSSES